MKKKTKREKYKARNESTRNKDMKTSKKKRTKAGIEDEGMTIKKSGCWHKTISLVKIKQRNREIGRHNGAEGITRAEKKKQKSEAREQKKKAADEQKMGEKQTHTQKEKREGALQPRNGSLCGCVRMRTHKRTSDEEVRTNRKDNERERQEEKKKSSYRLTHAAREHESAKEITKRENKETKK